MITYLRNIPSYKKLTLEERLRTYLDEKVIQQVTTKECGEELVHILSLEGSAVLAFSEGIPTLYVRPGFGKRLIIAAQILAKKNVRLVINETFRDIQKQRRQFQLVYETFQKQFPSLSKKALWERATQFSADPDLCPPHCTGGAADVYLAHAITGQLLDMGGPINALGSQCELMNEEISLVAQQNRRLLLDAMIEAGCAPLPTEWWHFSYGEKYWAAFYDTKALYDVVSQSVSIDSEAVLQ